jgi:hypothetical protein
MPKLGHPYPIQDKIYLWKVILSCSILLNDIQDNPGYSGNPWI